VSKWKAAAIAVGSLLLSAAFGALALFWLFYIAGPRRVKRDYTEYVRRHPAGTSLTDLTADPFFAKATMVTLTDPARPRTMRSIGPNAGAEDFARVRAELSAEPRGFCEIMWTHTPPFGRYFLDVEFKAGRVVSARPGSLD